MTSRFGPLSTTRYVANGVPFDMVRVPPGRLADSDGAHKRELLISRPFELGVTLVTQALWRAVTGNNSSLYQGDDYPVERVSWDHVQAFLGQLEALGLLGFRLPTDAEWVWAARCGVAARWAGADRAEAVAVVNVSQTAPVASLSGSAVGALDLSGNVVERQSDAWSDEPVAGVDVQNHPWEFSRISRGGGWSGISYFARINQRHTTPLQRANTSLGLRLARTTP